jgi:phosphoribosyl 1,2-cyclic phosphodiesterase
MITVETLGSSSKGNCYRLKSGERSLLLECGMPWKEIRRKLNFETSKLDGCLVSHFHADHARCLGDLLKNGVTVHATEDTFSQWDSANHHRAKKVTSKSRYVIDQHWAAWCFDTVHDAPGSVGFIVSDGEDRLAFLTDTAYCQYIMPQCSIIMIEANYSEAILAANVEAGHIEPARAKRVLQNHMSIERVIDFCKQQDLSKCRLVYLIHLSDGNSNADLFKKMVQEATGIPVRVEG